LQLCYLHCRLASEGIVTLGVMLCVCPPSRGKGIVLHLECFCFLLLFIFFFLCCLTYSKWTWCDMPLLAVTAFDLIWCCLNCCRQNHDYVIITGARRKEQRWDPHENEQIVPEGLYHCSVPLPHCILTSTFMWNCRNTVECKCMYVFIFTCVTFWNFVSVAISARGRRLCFYQCLFVCSSLCPLDYSQSLNICGVAQGTVDQTFYPRDAMLARVFAIATCLSVRPSATRRYCA